MSRSRERPVAGGFSAKGAQAATAAVEESRGASRRLPCMLDMDRRMQLLPDPRHAEEHASARPRAGPPARCGSTRRSSRGSRDSSGANMVSICSATWHSGR